MAGPAVGEGRECPGGRMAEHSTAQRSTGAEQHSAAQRSTGSSSPWQRSPTVQHITAQEQHGSSSPWQHSPRCPCARRQRGRRLAPPRHAPPPAAPPTGLHPGAGGGGRGEAAAEFGSYPVEFKQDFFVCRTWQVRPCVRPHSGGVRRSEGQLEARLPALRAVLAAPPDQPSSSAGPAQPTWVLLLKVLPEFVWQAGRQRRAHKATGACGCRRAGAGRRARAGGRAAVKWRGRGGCCHSCHCCPALPRPLLTKSVAQRCGLPHPAARRQQQQVGQQGTDLGWAAPTAAVAAAAATIGTAATAANGTAGTAGTAAAAADVIIAA